MAETGTIVHEIKLRAGSHLCEVTAGASRRVYISSRHAVGMALLQDAGVAPEPSIREIRWTDMLVSHGVAVGVKGLERIVIAVVPQMKRTVQWTGPAFATPTSETGVTGTYPLDITFPPVLAMLRTNELRYVRAYMFCVLPAALKTLTVSGEVNSLASFPYGNVYSSGGRICWGTVGHASLNTMEDLLHAFFSSGFNNDLFAPSACGTRRRNLWELVKETSGVVTSPPAPYFTMNVATQLRRLLGNETEE
jgi:hypothetical protein